MTQREQLGAALRDFEGAKARVERDARQVADDMRKQLVAQLLPVMDNLDRTIQSATAHGDAPAAVEGVGLVRTQLEAVLRGYGAVRIEAVGASFDPTVHEAVTTRPVPTAAMHDQVVEQLAPGYRFGAHLLRPAQVVVGKQAPAPIAEPPESRAVSAAAPDDRAARDDRDAPEDRDERVAEARADDALADDARADDARANEAQVREAQVREAQVREAQVREARR